MPTIRPSPNSRSDDKETLAIIYEGATANQLSIMFGMNVRTVKEKIAGLEPVGERRGVEIYNVRKACDLLVSMTEEQVDKAIRRLNHADLPKALSKEYWAGQVSRQNYMLREGDLWPTSKVVEEVSEMVKALKTELDLLTDGIERTTEMTDRQRQVAQQLINGAKRNMLNRLQSQFETHKKPEIVVIPDDDDEL